jgi:hypothetical protein
LEIGEIRKPERFVDRRSEACEIPDIDSNGMMTFAMQPQIDDLLFGRVGGNRRRLNPAARVSSRCGNLKRMVLAASI